MNEVPHTFITKYDQLQQLLDRSRESLPKGDLTWLETRGLMHVVDWVVFAMKTRVGNEEIGVIILETEAVYADLDMKGLWRIERMDRNTAISVIDHLQSKLDAGMKALSNMR